LVDQEPALSPAGLPPTAVFAEDMATRVPDTSRVTVTAQAVAARRNDGAPEQIVGRLRLEPYITAAGWQIDHAVPEA